MADQLTVEQIEAKYLAEIVQLVAGVVGITDVTKDDLRELRTIPEVNASVKAFVAEKRQSDAMPDWSREAGITLGEWQQMLQLQASRRDVYRASAEKRLKAAESYRSQLAEITRDEQSRLPRAADEKVERLAKAKSASVADLGVKQRALLILKCRGKSEDEKSVLVNAAVQLYRLSLFRA